MTKSLIAILSGLILGASSIEAAESEDNFSEKNTRMTFDDKSTDPPHLLLPLIRSSVSLLSIRGYSPSFASLVLIPDAEVGLVVVRVLLIVVLVVLVVIVVVPQGGDGSGRVGG